VPVINYSLGKGDWLAQRAHAYGGKVIATVTSVKHGASCVLECGCEELTSMTLWNETLFFSSFAEALPAILVCLCFYFLWDPLKDPHLNHTSTLQVINNPISSFHPSLPPSPPPLSKIRKSQRRRRPARDRTRSCRTRGGRHVFSISPGHCIEGAGAAFDCSWWVWRWTRAARGFVLGSGCCGDGYKICVHGGESVA